MSTDKPKIHLVYPFGGSDLQLYKEANNRRRNIDEYVELLLTNYDPQTYQVTWDRDKNNKQRSLRISASGEPLASLPILGETLAFIREKHAEAHITLTPIYSQQSPPDKGDTKPLHQIIQHIPRLINRQKQILVLEEGWTISGKLYDYTEMADTYKNELWEKYLERAHVIKAKISYFQMTGGTPAMTYGASTFARDPLLKFLYVPFEQSTKEVYSLNHWHSKRTEKLAHKFITSQNWDQAADVLEQPYNGITPIFGKHCRQPQISFLRGLHKWEQKKLTEAKNEFDLAASSRNNSWKHLLFQLCQSRKRNDEAYYPNLYAAIVTDTYVRFALTWNKEDLPNTIFLFYKLLESSLIEIISKIFPTTDIRKTPPETLSVTLHVNHTNWSQLDKKFAVVNYYALRQEEIQPFANFYADKIQNLANAVRLLRNELVHTTSSMDTRQVLQFFSQHNVVLENYKSPNDFLLWKGSSLITMLNSRKIPIRSINLITDIIDQTGNTQLNKCLEVVNSVSNA